MAVMVVMVVVVLVVAVTSSPVAEDSGLFEGCLVSAAVNMSVAGRRAAQVEFWGLVGAAGNPVMEVQVGASGGFGQTRVTLTHTHAVASRLDLMTERQWEWRMAGRVGAGWRRFLLAAAWRDAALRLALTDDRGGAWLTGAPPLPSARWVRVALPLFNTTCRALTPVWRVEAGGATEVPLSPLPRHLQFAVVGGRQPRLTLHHTELNLSAAAGSDGQDTPPTTGPLLLRLTLDDTRPAAPPRLVASGVRGVVEVAAGGPVAAVWFSGEGGDAFFVVQQLHVFQDTQVSPGDAAPCPGVTTANWPVLAGAAAALLLAGVGVGAGVCRLTRTRVVAATAASVSLPATAQPQPRENAAPQKPDPPYPGPRSPFPQAPRSLLVALPASPAAGLRGWRGSAWAVAPRKSTSLYLQPRPGPCPAPAPPPWRNSSPEDAYEDIDPDEAAATGSLGAADSFASDDDDDNGDPLYCN